VHTTPAAKHLTPCPFLTFREAFCAAIRFIDTTPLYGVKGVHGSRGWWLQPPFVPPCASMAPLGQLDATALAANAVVASDRYLPPYASYRHATFDGKAFAAFTAGGSAALPLFTTTHLIGASITSTVNLAFEFSVVKTFYVGEGWAWKSANSTAS